MRHLLFIVTQHYLGIRRENLQELSDNKSIKFQIRVICIHALSLPRQYIVKWISFLFSCRCSEDSNYISLTTPLAVIHRCIFVHRALSKLNADVKLIAFTVVFFLRLIIKNVCEFSFSKSGWRGGRGSKNEFDDENVTKLRWKRKFHNGVLL